MSKTTTRKIDESENSIIATIDHAQAKARTGRTPQVPDLEQYRQERVADLNKESAKYGRK